MCATLPPCACKLATPLFYGRGDLRQNPGPYQAKVPSTFAAHLLDHSVTGETIELVDELPEDLLCNRIAS